MVGLWPHGLREEVGAGHRKDPPPQLRSSLIHMLLAYALYAFLLFLFFLFFF